jgi:hypothetical protein
MKNFIFYTILFSMSSQVIGQDFNCEKYYTEFCKTIQIDTSQIPNYTAGLFYSGEKTNPNRMSIEGCIDDLDAFCEGIKRALDSEKLAIRQVGDPGHVSQCTYYSFERLGVKLVMTGDIILDARIFDENAGFNFIMEKRIKENIGDENYKLLGLKDSTWLEFNSDLHIELMNAIKSEIITDSTASIRLDSLKLVESKFHHLKGVVFTDCFSNFKFDSLDFQNGFKIVVKGENKKYGILKIDFKNYENPMFCKGGFNSEWTVIIKITQ